MTNYELGFLTEIQGELKNKSKIPSQSIIPKTSEQIKNEIFEFFNKQNDQEDVVNDYLNSMKGILSIEIDWDSNITKQSLFNLNQQIEDFKQALKTQSNMDVEQVIKQMRLNQRTKGVAFLLNFVAKKDANKLTPPDFNIRSPDDFYQRESQGGDIKKKYFKHIKTIIKLRQELLRERNRIKKEDIDQQRREKYIITRDTSQQAFRSSSQFQGSQTMTDFYSTDYQWKKTISNQQKVKQRMENETIKNIEHALKQALLDQNLLKKKDDLIKKNVQKKLEEKLSKTKSHNKKLLEQNEEYQQKQREMQRELMRKRYQQIKNDKKIEQMWFQKKLDEIKQRKEKDQLYEQQRQELQQYKLNFKMIELRESDQIMRKRMFKDREIYQKQLSIQRELEEKAEQKQQIFSHNLEKCRSYQGEVQKQSINKLYNNLQSFDKRMKQIETNQKNKIKQKQEADKQKIERFQEKFSQTQSLFRQKEKQTLNRTLTKLSSALDKQQSLKQSKSTFLNENNYQRMESNQEHNKILNMRQKQKSDIIVSTQREDLEKFKQQKMEREEIIKNNMLFQIQLQQQKEDKLDYLNQIKQVKSVDEAKRIIKKMGISLDNFNNLLEKPSDKKKEEIVS